MTTTNKSLNTPAYNSTAWDVPLNANFTSIDTAFGGYTLLNPTSASGTIFLTSTQYTPPIIVIGTGLPVPGNDHTAPLSNNVDYRIPAGVGGYWFVFNNTSGNYTVTISTGGSGAVTSVELRQNTTTAIICDGTNIGFADTNPVYASGSNTQVQYNNNGVLGGSSSLTWDTYSATFTGTIAAATSFTGTIAAGTSTLVTTGVTGTIQIGMTLGTITGGTFVSASTVTILSQVSGTTGGAGTYTISQTNTAGTGATVASAASNALVVTGVSGTIRIGMTLGTITGGTFTPPVTILSQSSGTTGGAGTYVLSQVNTGGTGATVGSASYSALAAPNLIGNVTGNAATATTAATATIATSATTATTAGTATTATYASTVTGTALAIGYLQIPQSTNTTAAASDVGKHIYVSSSVTINSGIFNAGDSFVIVNSNTATTSTSIIAGSGVTLRFAGTTSTGTRTLAPNAVASVLCVASNTFLISGAGVS